jgi:hypothetical protein
MELVNSLREKNITYIGTVKSNSRLSIPSDARSTEGRQRKDTKIYKEEQHGTFLVSFWDKGAKPVLLLDSFYPTVPTPERNTKAISILEYNRTKSGVDIADKRLRGLTCKRKCRRWPYAIFSNMVDVSTNNASIIYSSRHPNESRKQEQHYAFLKALGYQLIHAHIQKRLQNLNQIHASTANAIIPNRHLLKWRGYRER